MDYYGKDIGRDCGTPENGFRSVFADNCQFINAYDLQEDGVPFIDTTTYLTDLLGDKAVQYIQEHDNTQPMLMNYHLTGPHTPMQAPVELINICNNVTPTYASVQPTYRQILCGMVASVDINLLRVLLALAVKGMLESTLIVFMSDNGGLELAGSVNQPFRGGKLTEFEGGLRVPAFLYGKELFPANRLTPIRKDLVHVADILPTILDYAGFPLFTLGQDIDGINNWLQLMAGTPFVRDFIPINDASKIVLYTGGYIKILKGVMWKYLFNPSFLGQLAIIPNEQPLNYQPEGEMLFNLSDDPYETTNLVPTVRGPYMSFVLWYLRTLKWSQGLGRGVSPELLQFPPPVSVPPSQGGCWLPLDSPFYNTFICPV